MPPTTRGQLEVQAPLDRLRHLRDLQIEADRRARVLYRADFPTPGALAAAIEPGTVQTPALDVVDDALADVEAGDCDRLMVWMPPQEGKALALDTPIATPTGWTTTGALRVGDQVFDRQGEPCRVTWVSPIWRDRDCYVVRTGDGEAIVADAVHDWPARLDRRGQEALRTSETLAKHRKKNARIIGPAALNLPDADLPLDPYVLGAWLGDGHSASPRMTLHPDDEEIRARFADAGWPLRKASDRYGWTMVPALWTSSKSSPARRALVAAGVFDNKHIPDIYLRASEKQRLALLQGLIDTDGYVMPKGQVEFCSTSRRLAEGVRELVYSLGAKAVMGVGRATIDGRDCGPKYRVRFYLRDAAWLTRKAERCKDSSVARVRYVYAELTASVPTRCIEVDSPDHTYLAGRTMLPTHNSTRVTVMTPLWMLARDPNRRVGIATHSQDLANDFGSAIRNYITGNSGEDDTLDLGLRIAPDNGAAHRWRLDGYRGGVRAVGIAGSLTGRPLDALIIDDPVANMEQAQSVAYQQRAMNFWQAVGSTRLAPGAPVIVVLTRWHENDLAGKLLAAEDGHRWRVVSIPAIAESPADPLGREPGEPMISARGDRDWDAIRVEKGEYVWAALYQQRPAPAEGGLFKRALIKHWTWATDPTLGRKAIIVNGREVYLETIWTFLTVDLAISKRTSADYTAVGVWGITLDGELLLLDGLRSRLGEDEHFPNVDALRSRWNAGIVFVEASQHGTTLVYEAGRTGTPIGKLTADTDKFTRALPASRRAGAGRLFVPSVADAPWVSDWIDEWAAFPNAAHDDTVDVLSYAATVAAEHWLAMEPAEQTEQRIAAERAVDAEFVDLLSAPL